MNPQTFLDTPLGAFASNRQFQFHLGFNLRHKKKQKTFAEILLANPLCSTSEQLAFVRFTSLI